MPCFGQQSPFISSTGPHFIQISAEAEQNKLRAVRDKLEELKNRMSGLQEEVPAYDSEAQAEVNRAFDAAEDTLRWWDTDAGNNDFLRNLDFDLHIFEQLLSKDPGSERTDASPKTRLRS
jgi:hypothetical protein